MSDVCDVAPCLVLMNGDSPVGFIPTGWEPSGDLEFSRTEIETACRHVSATP